MIKTYVLAATTFVSLLLAFSPAEAAGISRAWVSGKGTDAAGCGAPSNPCRTFQYVHDNIIAAGGEIDVLDPAGYGAIAIAKAISIVNDGVGTAGVQAASGNAITINAGGGDAIYLRGLSVEGLGTGAVGLQFNTGGRLTVINCAFRHFTAEGVYLAPTGPISFSISNTVVDDNASNGVYIAPVGAGSAQGTITNVEANGNGFDGIAVDGQNLTGNANSNITIVGSVASNNASMGVAVQSGQMSVLARETNASFNGFAGFVTTLGGVLRLSRSVATGNSQGVSSIGTVYTYDDNSIVGNSAQDINATMSNLSSH